MSEQRTGLREQRTVKRRIATAAMAIGVVLFGIAVAPGVASAHTPRVEPNCSGLVVILDNYEAPATNNRVSITIDGAAQSFLFGPDFEQTFSWSSTSNHTWSVFVDANLTNGSPTEYDSTFSGTQVACVATTTTTTATTTTTTAPPTTTTTVAPTTTTTTPGATTTTLAGATTTTTGAPTTTVEQAGPTTTASVGQQGPTSSVNQSSGAATTVGGSLPATGAGDDSASLIVVALTLIGIGGVMLRLTSKSEG